MHAMIAQMAERIARFSWETTSIGPQATWPPVLRTMVDVALKTRFPMLIWWGENLVQIYNDAYIPLMGARHPAALGQRAQDCWPEVWDTVGPLIQDARVTGTPSWGEDVQFTLERNGAPEVAYFTFSYSQIGGVEDEGGVLCTNVETTQSVLRELEFRDMADNLAHIIYTHAADGSISWANSRWFEFTRLPAESATDIEAWKPILPADDHRNLKTVIEDAFAAGVPYEAEIRIKPLGSNDSAYRWHLLRAVPIRNQAGVTLRWAGSATDVHDRRIAEEALRNNLLLKLDREHRASLAFQNAALPQRLPKIPGITFDAIYEAAGTDAYVGGDWYDAFRLPGGRVVISVGDVIGSGLAAAVTMAAARQAIRGAAQVYPEPAAVLDAADRTLRSEQTDRIVTAFLGIFDPLTLVLSYASAGHPPPMLRHPDGAIVELTDSALPLGLRDERITGENRSIVLPRGGLLVLYTDGLTETTRDVLDGERRLRETLGLPRVYDTLSPAGAIRDAMLTTATDDVAILTIRFGEEPAEITRWYLQASDAAAATDARHAFAKLLQAAGVARTDVADAELIFGELLGNVLRHTSGETEIALDLSENYPVLHVLDRGTGYTFYATLPRDGMSESGRGLFIITQLAHEVSVVRRTDGGSHARVVINAKLARR